MVGPGDTCSPAVHDLLCSARTLLEDAEAFIVRLRNLCDELEAVRGGKSADGVPSRLIEGVTMTPRR
jgi:hypothetical protein